MRDSTLTFIDHSVILSRAASLHDVLANTTDIAHFT